MADTSNKSCELDPINTKLLKSNIGILSQIIADIANCSFTSGKVCQDLKDALLQLLQKGTLDQNLLTSYRPVSALTYLSKLLERPVAKQLIEYTESTGMMEHNQSAYCKNCSTETCLLKLKTDILDAINKKEVVCLVLLDLSAAFDSLEHSLIINRLKYRFGVVGKCLDWFEDYLLNRTQCITVCDSTGNIAESGKHILQQGIPQGSVLGPLIFNLFLSPLGEICCAHGINFSGYADDSQNYLSFRPIKDNLTPQHNCTECLEKCLAEVWTWMKYNFLKLNDLKTEFIVFGVHQQLSKVQDITVTLGDVTIHETPVVRNLGMFFDKELKHTAHINRLTSSSFHCLQNVARIRHQLDTQTAKTIIQALVISKLGLL